MIGTRLYGYCEGYFGRDAHSVKVVRHFGRHWVFVTSEEHTAPNIAVFADGDEMRACLARWSREGAQESP